MKQKIYLLLAGLLLITLQLKAQAPAAFNYQAVARDVAGNVLANQALGLRFTIHQSTAVGTVVYQEEQSQTTNIFGLFSASIGSGIVLSGNMSTISWGTNAYYLQVEMDPTGGTNYINMGEPTQLLSVPYALYAGNGGGSSGKTYSAGKGIGIVDTVISADISDALWNANKLQGDSVSITAPTTGQVLQWDGTAWVPTTPVIPSNGWNLTGNAGTTAGTDFIGTTDGNDVVFKADAKEAMRIDNINGYVGIGTSTPNQQLEIDATANNGSDFGGYNMVVEIAETNSSGNMSGLYLNGSTNPGNQLAGIVTRGGNNEAFYAGTNNNWDYRLAGMQTIDQNGLTNAKDGSAGLTLLNSNGFLGIGTNSPSQLLHVVDVNNNQSDFGGYNFQIEVEAQDQGNGATNAGIYINGSSNDNGLAGIVMSSFSTGFYTGLNNNYDFRIAGVNGIDGGDLTNAKDGTSGITVQESSGNVGIGTNSPAQALDVESGSVQFSQALMPAGDAGQGGQVLQSNGANNPPTWVTFSSSGTPAWNLIGNVSTVYGTNFVGNSDDQSLMFKINDQVAGRIEDNNSGNNSYLNTSLGYQALNSLTPASNGNGTDNEAFGYQALMNDNTGASNTAIGTYALVGNTTGNSNIAIGLFAIDGENGTTTGSNNVVVGVGAQYSGSGNQNTSIGGNAGHGITSSSSSVAVGYEALAGSMNNGQDPGSQNVAVGSYALFNNYGAAQNVAVGDSALTSNYGGTDNSALGYQSLASNQYATDNTAIGFDAMLNNDNDGYGSSSQNTAVGSQSLYYNIDGQWNTAEGYQALYSNQYAIQNTAVGYQALYNNDNTGDNNAWYNVAIGSQAMQANTDGQWNACLGTVALLYNTTGTQNTAIGSPAMYNNQTGDYNVALGTNALNTNVTGNYNMALGYVADVSIDGLNNATAIGAYAQAINSNSIVLGSNGTNGTAVTEIDMNGSLSPWNGSVYDPGTAGYVLQSNGAGTAPTWVAASGGGGASWNLTGNAIAYNYSATPTTFIGTTNSYGFEFGVNGGEAGRVEANYGSQNTALGWGSLQNGAGQANTAIGINAAQLASGGSYNVSMGWEAFGDYSDGGSYNVAIGGGALAGPGGSAGDGDDNNTAVGYFALVANDAANNTALGYGAASSGLNSSPATNLTGSPITAIGFETLFSNTSGSDNVALGYQSLYSNVDASTNTAIGDNALFSNGTGGGNTAVGFGALFNNAVSQNVAVGDSAMASNSTGTNNTALGYQSLSTNQTGNNITAVGYNANVASDGLTNSIALGSGATITMSNQLIIPATVTHVNMAGIPAFANDAAAGTGGLVKGDMYQTDGTGVAPLNVAGILMIKQ